MYFNLHLIVLIENFWKLHKNVISYICCASVIAEKIEEWREQRDAGEIIKTEDDNDSRTANINDEVNA